MKQIVVGFIGTGNMGSALARAAGRRLSGRDILLANRSPEKAELLARQLGAEVVSNDAAAQRADYILLGVKPQVMEEMLSSIAPILAERRKRLERFVLVSMATGLTIARIQELAGGACPVIRIMPNTPVSIGEGMVLYACSLDVTEEEKQLFLEAFAEAGRFSEIPEFRMDAGSALAACGPAFVDIFLEALADGGVACGIARAQAYELAAQMMIGTAMLALASGQHPGVLKDAVCSPGGTTIQGVRKLEEAGFRGAVMDAVIASYERTLELK